MKKKTEYTVRLWYTWYKDFYIEAESAEKAYDLACNKSWEEITEDFCTDDLAFDDAEVFNGEGEPL